ncbi:rhomboid family intramembrane serine protease [Candidatus Nanohalobium constans]|uniref:Rhomboid family protein n=1 Tax=Candidatus Nanohalobium constans TaxID=2565781 RepID=A0A5Q0UHQ0_9ARCH|nr:rhomboid family intramembrane serine protease [Candidatus Nanohalobium constans]QGA80419.1 rhomboid family protein [Candidatus Nanohalobium constans]
MEKQKTGFNYTALKLCSLLVAVYTIQTFSGFNPGFKPGEPFWKFFTSIIGHSGIEHLTNNLFFIALFGSIYEKWTSSKTFLTTFLISALAGNLTAFIFYPNSFIIGASAGGMGVMAALAAYRPNQIGLGLGVPLPMWAVLLSYILIDLSGLTAATNVANEAHLLGVLAGSIIGIQLRDKKYGKEKNSDNTELEDSWKQKIRDWEEKWMID